MDNVKQMKGAWILPDGSIHYTDNVQSHHKVIEELGIKDKLMSCKPKFQENDLSLIALKLGYARITCYCNSFGIEIGDNVSSLQARSIVAACNELYDYDSISENWTIELIDGSFKQFATRYEAYRFLTQLAN